MMMLRPCAALKDTTVLVPLLLLVLGDEAARAAVADSRAITIDGCKLACATKLVKESGGEITRDYAVLDVILFPLRWSRRNRDSRPVGR